LTGLILGTRLLGLDGGCQEAFWQSRLKGKKIVAESIKILTEKATRHILYSGRN